MSRQLTHYNTEFESRKYPLVLILDGLNGPANLGGIFRLADAFHIEKIILCGPEIELNSPRIKRTARATLEKVAFEQGQEALDTCTRYIEMGYDLMALEITNDSIALDTYDFQKHKKIALVLGNENVGIQREVLERCPIKLHIRMFGQNSSMNVAQATGIALYEITKSLPTLI